MSRDCVHLKTLCFDGISESQDSTSKNSSDIVDSHTACSQCLQHLKQVNKNFIVATVQIKDEVSKKHSASENEGVIGRLINAIRENDTIQNVIIPLFEPPEESKSTSQKAKTGNQDLNSKFVRKSIKANQLQDQSTETDVETVTTHFKYSRRKDRRQHPTKPTGSKNKHSLKQKQSNKKHNRRYERRKRVVSGLEELANMIQMQRNKYLKELEEMTRARELSKKHSDHQQIKPRIIPFHNQAGDNATGIGDHESQKPRLKKKAPAQTVRQKKEETVKYGGMLLRTKSSCNQRRKRKLTEELKKIEEREKSHLRRVIAQINNETSHSDTTMNKTCVCNEERIRKLEEALSKTSQAKKLSQKPTYEKSKESIINKKSIESLFNAQTTSFTKQDSDPTTSSDKSLLSSTSSTESTDVPSKINKRSLSTIREGSKESSSHRRITNEHIQEILQAIQKDNATKFIQTSSSQTKTVTFKNCQCPENMQVPRERPELNCFCHALKSIDEQKVCTKIIRYRDACENTCETQQKHFGNVKQKCNQIKRKMQLIESVNNDFPPYEHLKVPSYLSPRCCRKHKSFICPPWCPKRSREIFSQREKLSEMSSESVDLFACCYKVWCQICFYIALLLIVIVLILILFFIK